jgi:hypothetical protein
MRPVGFGSQVLNTIKGVLGLEPVLLSPVGRSESPSIRRSTSRQYGPQGFSIDAGEHVGRHNGLPTRVCLRMTVGTSDVDVMIGEGSTRSEYDHGESASSALKKVPVSEVRRITISRS